MDKKIFICELEVGNGLFGSKDVLLIRANDIDEAYDIFWEKCINNSNIDDVFKEKGKSNFSPCYGPGHWKLDHGMASIDITESRILEKDTEYIFGCCMGGY